MFSVLLIKLLKESGELSRKPNFNIEKLEKLYDDTFKDANLKGPEYVLKAKLDGEFKKASTLEEKLLVLSNNFN